MDRVDPSVALAGVNHLIESCDNVEVDHEDKEMLCVWSRKKKLD